MPKLKMWPTSIAVWKRSAPPQTGHVSPSRASRMSANRGVVVAPRLDAEQVPAVAVRAGDELALAQRLVGDDLDARRRPARASRHSRRTRSGSPRRSPAGSRSRARRASSTRRAGRRRGRDRARACRPSCTTGIAFDVAAASIPRSSASASIVVTPGVATSFGASCGRRENRRLAGRPARSPDPPRSRRSRR